MKKFLFPLIVVATPSFAQQLPNPAFRQQRTLDPTVMSLTNPGDRGPSFIWSNPPQSGCSVGRNAGQQIWVGPNPTATPAAGGCVASTIAITNGNGRFNSEALNVVGVEANAPGDATYLNNPVVALEVDIAAGWDASPNPFLSFFPSGQPAQYQKNGLEVYGTQGSGSKHFTSYISLWTPATTGAAGSDGTNWPYEGIAIARANNYGIHMYKNPGGLVDTSVSQSVASILDDTDSASLLRVTGAHSNLIDLTTAPSPSFFVRGATSADTNLNIANSAPFNLNLSIGSGDGTTKRFAGLRYADGPTVKWQQGKDLNNDFILQAGPSGATAMKASATNGSVAVPVLGTGGITPGFPPSWLNTLVPGTAFSIVTPSIGISPPGSRSAAAFLASHTSDQLQDASGLFPTLNIFNWVDSNPYGKPNWGQYTEGDFTDTTTVSQFIANETSLFSTATSPTVAPSSVNPAGHKTLLRLDCGKGAGVRWTGTVFDVSGTGTTGALAQDCSSALEIVNNGAKVQSGIVIDKNALTARTDGWYEAMSMGPLQALSWKVKDANPYQSHWSIVDTGSAAVSNQSLQLGDGTALFSTTVAGTAVRANPVTYAALVATVPCNSTTEGMFAAITDAPSHSAGAVISTGGGTLHVPVECDGTSYRALY